MKTLAKLLQVLVTVAVSLVLCTGASSDLWSRDALPEYVIKAGYLYHFGQLTEWPQQTEATEFTLCYYGSELAGKALAGLVHKKINGQPINVRYIDDAASAKACRMLFIAETDDLRSKSILRESARLPVLTVTDSPALADQGAVIFLRPEGQKLVFEIDNELAKQAQLTISSRLLRLGK